MSTKTGIVHKHEHEDSKQHASYESIRAFILRDEELLADGTSMPKDIQEAGHAARCRYGAASGAARWITGTNAVHLGVEKTIAAATRLAEAMTFPDSYLGLISTVAGRCRPLIDYDKHYVLIPKNAPEAVLDGIKARSEERCPNRDQAREC